MAPEPAVHRRYDPLADEWVLVSPHRSKRPWQGQLDEVAPAREAHGADCYLCPGNERVGGVRNPDYEQVHVFDNDFPALLSNKASSDALDALADAAPPPSADASLDHAERSLLRSTPVAGRSRVICYSPRHDLSLGELTPTGRRAVVATWVAELEALGRDWAWVQCFENRGAMMGCSSPHPHGQIWALDEVPTLVARERSQQCAHFDRQGSPLLVDVLAEELAAGERIVASNRHWVVLVPYWARWPFETLLLPRRPLPCLTETTAAERDALAEMLGVWMCAMDNLFQCDFPYSFGWHPVPPGADARTRDAWTLHAHCYPPLLRSATVRKFMVGFELLAEAQRDLTPEAAAARLRDALGPHWRTLQP